MTSVYDYAPERGSVGVRFNAGRRYGKSATSQHALRALGVLGNKHIPDVYLWASAEQRLTLLQGLMDSDGYVNERGNCTFTNASRPLVDAVVHLARSLGWRASAGEWQSDVRWKLRTAGTWRVSFTPSGLVPFRLKRKVERCRVAPHEKRRAIAAIEPVESMPVQCIAVDSDDHLFLAGPGMLPTHNTHLYRLPELQRMYATVRRNLAKRRAAEPWSLETSTMYAPGERSVAEATHTLARRIRQGKAAGRLLFDHRQGPGEVDLEDEAGLRAALAEAYGDFAAVVDLERLMAEIQDPRNAWEDSRRFFLNVATPSGGRFLEPAAWAACAAPEQVVEDRAAITVGFDGSLRQDATALRGCTKEGHLFTIGIWERPEGPPGDGWQVPTAEVDAAVAAAFERYRVVRAYFDPAWWGSWVATWAARHGIDKVVEWWTNRDAPMAKALEAIHTAIVQRELSHDGDPIAVRHWANAHRRPSRMKDEEGRPMVLIGKDRPGSPNKIDVAMADTLAFEARNDALAAGLFVEEVEPWAFYGTWR